MMDRTLRDEMLRALDSGQMHVKDAVDRYKLSERHVHRLLSAYRKKQERSAVRIPPGESVSMKTPMGNVTVTNDGIPKVVPDIPKTPAGAPMAPSMSDIDKALAGQNATPGIQAEPPMTSDMALDAIRFAKSVGVIWGADVLGVTDEKAVMKLTAVQPITEAIIRKQSPETLAKVGEALNNPYVLPIILTLDMAFTAYMLYRLRPKQETGEIEDAPKA